MLYSSVRDMYMNGINLGLSEVEAGYISKVRELVDSKYYSLTSKKLRELDNKVIKFIFFAILRYRVKKFFKELLSFK